MKKHLPTIAALAASLSPGAPVSAQHPSAKLAQIKDPEGMISALVTAVDRRNRIVTLKGFTQAAAIAVEAVKK